MNTDQVAKLHEILTAAIGKSTSERAAFLDQECAGDPTLRANVEAMLRNDPGEPTPDRIAGFAILAKIGEGGMGIVYLARRERHPRDFKALKVIRPGMDSNEVLARFEAEQKALALLDHPNIVKFAEPGLTDDQRPFFTMEYIRGAPITEYCEDNGLDLKARLALFAEVCEAVEHAHKKGIVHRDLKPTNILVCILDGKPVPKVIDWGIAKALNFELSERTLFTQQARWVTPEYMAPETLGKTLGEVDPRTDVYSLGVLLYELLAGTTPVDGPTLAAKVVGELARFLLEFQPDRPSTRRRRTASTIVAQPRTRGIDIDALPWLSRAEIDEIALKALASKPAHRFQSAAEFAECIHRYLRGEAIFDTPFGPLWARLLRHTHRHRRAYGAAAACIFLSTAAYIVATPYIASARCDASVENINDWFNAKRDASAVDGAIEMADGARSDCPTSSRVLSAQIHYRLKRLEQSSPTEPTFPEDLQKALQLTDEYFTARMQDENEWKFWNYKTDLFVRSGNLQGAMDANVRAIELAPPSDQFRPRVFQVAILALQKRFNEAAAAALEGVHRIGDDARDIDRDELHRHLGAIQFYLAKLEEAHSSFDRARTIDKDHRTDIMLARYLLRQGQSGYQRAHELAAVEGDYKSPYYDRILALTRLRIGQYHGAIEAAERVQAGPDPVPAFRHLIIAIAQVKLGNRAEANAAFKAAAEDPSEAALENASTLVTFNNQFLWIEEYSELKTLYDEAKALVGASSAMPSSGSGETGGK